jgi:FtsZ-binding cell division protein ZapB
MMKFHSVIYILAVVSAGYYAFFTWNFLCTISCYQSKQLEDEFGPLRETCQEVTAQRDALQREVEIFQVEVDRWKARTNHLIEQCNKFDPEEHKRAM